MTAATTLLWTMGVAGTIGLVGPQGLVKWGGEAELQPVTSRTGAEGLLR